jgi:hypothetical protein
MSMDRTDYLGSFSKDIIRRVMEFESVANLVASHEQCMEKTKIRSQPLSFGLMGLMGMTTNSQRKPLEILVSLTRRIHRYPSSTYTMMLAPAAFGPHLRFIDFAKEA